MAIEPINTSSPFRPPAPEPASQPLSPLPLLWAILRNPLRLWCREHFEKLQVVNRSMFGTQLVVSDPELIKQVLLDHDDNYVRDSVQQRAVLRLTGRSIFSAQGNDWRFQRKIYAPFFSAKMQAKYISQMIAVAEHAVTHFCSESVQPINLRHEMDVLAINTLERSVLSQGLGEPVREVACSVRKYANIRGPVELGDVLQLPVWVPGIRRILGWRNTVQVRQRARRIIAEAKQANRPADHDIVAALLSARNPDTGKKLPASVVESNLSTLLGAGSETTAIALTWAIFLISQTPHIRAAVESEVDRIGELNIDKLEQLVWTRAALEETMRLYPPAPLIGRMNIQAETLGGEFLPKGSSILIPLWVLHRHRKLWHEPDLFIPERFLPGQREQIPRFAYLPFGAGPRACLGMGFAMQEILIILATLFRKLRFDRADDHPVRLRHCISLQPEKPLWMRVSARKHDFQ